MGEAMLDTVKTLLANQYEATLCTLNACVERCPKPLWNTPIAKHAYNQVAFHTLFYADYYLGPTEAGFREQPFHAERGEAFFGDYEELYREPRVMYDRDSIRVYMDHVRGKAAKVIAAETDDTLAAPSGFERRVFSRAELHVYTIRHIQHHSAQLTLRLRLESDVDIPWFGSGWPDE